MKIHPFDRYVNATPLWVAILVFMFGIAGLTTWFIFLTGRFAYQDKRR